MARSDLAARVHDAPRRVHATVIVALVVAIGLVSWWSIEFRPPNAAVAYWWPAAALGAAAVIMARRRMLVTVGIFIAVFLANFAVGRPVSLDLGYALANAGTALAVGWIATAGGRYATIRSVRSAGRFILAVAVGALVVTIVGSATAWMFAGADPVATVFALYPSHASALLVLTPIALVDWRWRAVGRPFEAVLQSVVFVGVLFAAYWPDNPLPLGFTTIAVLLWAAFRMPVSQVAIQLGVLGIVATPCAFWRSLRQPNARSATVCRSGAIDAGSAEPGPCSAHPNSTRRSANPTPAESSSTWVTVANSRPT